MRLLINYYGPVGTFPTYSFADVLHNRLPETAFRDRPRSRYRPLYALRGGLRGAGASSTDAKIAANIERGF